MSILAFTAYLAMAYVVWFYLLTPHVKLLENAVWQLTKPGREAGTAQPVAPARLEAASDGKAGAPAAPPSPAPGPALQLRAA